MPLKKKATTESVLEGGEWDRRESHSFQPNQVYYDQQNILGRKQHEMINDE